MLPISSRNGKKKFKGDGSRFEIRLPSPFSTPASTAEETDPKKKNTMHWQSPGYPITDESAVSQVTWNDACAFCNWLSEQEKFQGWYASDGKGSWVTVPRGSGYRLPTEAEWEYACRAGTTTQYSFGDDVGQMGDYGWSQANTAGNATHTVGLKLPNPFGLYDMHGNVWEWCQDWYDEKWYAQPRATNPQGPSGGPTRVLRGGSWNATLLNGRSALRNSSLPANRCSYHGFRVAQVPGSSQ